jgi:hypothetical protein
MTGNPDVTDRQLTDRSPSVQNRYNRLVSFGQLRSYAIDLGGIWLVVMEIEEVPVHILYGELP